VGSAQSSTTSLTNPMLAFVQRNVQLLLRPLTYPVVSMFMTNWEVQTTANMRIMKVIMILTLESISNVKSLFSSSNLQNPSNRNTTTSKSIKSMKVYF
jgi:hypothetical protein